MPADKLDTRGAWGQRRASKTFLESAHRLRYLACSVSTLAHIVEALMNHAAVRPQQDHIGQAGLFSECASPGAYAFVDLGHLLPQDVPVFAQLNSACG